ncbi:nuclear transport factor 2 [Pyrrhoderma noxium]|uniref:Nuclear transport factor 2 n=1 Tax=Pyrrhoderma noxium TaxID=2282107 RepID=A0A286UUR2_9AGAM|nr:nuclear transport factor 2 [Pyrrhoderma noxium]
MADFNYNAIAQQFTQFYYSTFDTDRAQLAPLYRPDSMLTFEGAQHLGAQGIVSKLEELPFQKVVHQVTTMDVQPSSPTVRSMLVSVSGLLKVDDGEHPLQFSQIFHLVPDGDSYYVFNDIFRLNLG